MMGDDGVTVKSMGCFPLFSSLFALLQTTSYASLALSCHSYMASPFTRRVFVLFASPFTFSVLPRQIPGGLPPKSPVLLSVVWSSISNLRSDNWICPFSILVPLDKGVVSLRLAVVSPKGASVRFPIDACQFDSASCI